MYISPPRLFYFLNQMRTEGRGIILFLRETFFGLLTRDRRVWKKYLELWTPSSLGWNLDSTITFGSEPPPPPQL